MLYLSGVKKQMVMKNGRINERNIGCHKLDGGCKGSKMQIVEDTKKDLAIRIIKQLLKDGVKVYENYPELVSHWLKNGIAEIKEFENSCEMARSIYPTEKRAILIESKRSDVELVLGILETL